MKTNRVEHNVEHITHLKGSRVLADVSGFKVEIITLMIGDGKILLDERGFVCSACFRHLLTPQAIEKIKEELRDYTPVADAVLHDWELSGQT